MHGVWPVRFSLPTLSRKCVSGLDIWIDDLLFFLDQGRPLSSQAWSFHPVKRDLKDYVVDFTRTGQAMSSFWCLLLKQMSVWRMPRFSGKYYNLIDKDLQYQRSQSKRWEVDSLCIRMWWYRNIAGWFLTLICSFPLGITIFKSVAQDIELFILWHLDPALLSNS